MALINRVGRLFKADFNAVLDQIEEPELLLKQAIRDMEDELTAQEQRISLALHERAALKGRLSEIKATLDETAEQLDLCFASGKEDLVRNLIRRKLEAELLQKRLQGRYDATIESLEQQRRQLDENSSALESLRQKADVIAHRPPTTGMDETAFDDCKWLAPETAITDDQIEIAVLQEKSRRAAS